MTVPKSSAHVHATVAIVELADQVFEVELRLTRFDGSGETISAGVYESREAAERRAVGVHARMRAEGATLVTGLS